MFKRLEKDSEPNTEKISPFDQLEKTTNMNRSQLDDYSKLINHPSHYNQGKIEVIDAILDWGLDFIEGNIIKYVARSHHKSSRIGDLKKARWYLNYLINKLEKP